MKTFAMFAFLTFTSMTLLASSPPVPIVTVVGDLTACPGYYCDPNGYAHFVISTNGRSATVILDASASYDPDGAPLYFHWARIEEGQIFFSSSVRTTNVWYEDTRFRLYVSDDPSIIGVSRDFAVYLETPVGVIYGLIDAMDELQEPDQAITIRGRHALDVLLIRAAEQFEQGNIARMVESLQLFQKKISAQAPSLGPSNAADLVRIAQAVIDAVSSR